MYRSNYVPYCAVLVVAMAGSRTAAQFQSGVDDPFASKPSRDSRAEKAAATQIAAPTPAASDADDPARDHCQCVGENDSAAAERIAVALRSPLKSSGLNFDAAPLADIVEVLETDYSIPIELDLPAMEEIGIDAQEPATVSLHGISLRAALRLMLKPLQLTYVIRDEVLLITTPEEAEAELVTCVYDLRDLGNSTDGKSVDQLVDAIVSCVATETWAENGGGNARVCSVDPGLLVIAQTQAVHEEISSLLSTIRAVRQRPAPTAAARKRDPGTRDEEAVVTRAYTLELGDAAEPEAVRQQIRSLITSSLPNEQWVGQLDDGQHVLLTVLPDRVVLRHKQAVQEAVRKLLVDSGVAQAAPRIGEDGPPRGDGGYGGGYFRYGEGGRGGYGGGYGRYGGYGGPGGYGPADTMHGAEVPTPQPNESE